MARARGEGSVYRRKDGYWCASLQIAEERQVVYGRTRAAVVEKLRKLTNTAQQTGRVPTSSNLTVEAYLSTWLEQAKNRLRPTTVADYEVIIRVHVVPQIGHTKLTKLTALQISHFYTTLGKTLSQRRVRMVHELLHKALGDAAKWQLAPTNVAALVEAPKRNDKQPTLWQPEQVSRFVSAMLESEGNAYGNLFVFLLAAGCRIGEALGLLWRDIDLNRASVRIERQLVELSGHELYEAAPKTAAGTRTIVIPQFGLEALQRQRAQIAEWQSSLSGKWDSDRVFTSEVGTVPSRSNVRRSFDANCKRLDLPHIRLHDLRHLSLSLLAMSGVPVKVAQQRAGHSTPLMTLKVYQHVIGDADRQAAEALEASLRRA